MKLYFFPLLMIGLWLGSGNAYEPELNGMNMANDIDSSEENPSHMIIPSAQAFTGFGSACNVVGSQGALTQTSTKQDCNGQNECRSCSITMTGAQELNCGGESSCRGANATITALADFELKAGGESALYSDSRNNVVRVACSAGQKLKGFECTNKLSCYGQKFVVNGPCTIEYAKCSGIKGCADVTFVLNGATLQMLECDNKKQSCQRCKVIAQNGAVTYCSQYQTQ